MPALVVFLNKCDQVDDEELIELVELEVRELLDFYKFPGDDISVIQGSALCALEDPNEELGNAVLKLMEAVDAEIPTPERRWISRSSCLSKKLLNRWRGTVVTGRVEAGVLNVGDEIEITGIKETTKTTCTGIEMFKKQLDRGEAGDNLGALLRGLKREDAVRPGHLRAGLHHRPHKV